MPPGAADAHIIIPDIINKMLTMLGLKNVCGSSALCLSMLPLLSSPLYLVGWMSSLRFHWSILVLLACLHLITLGVLNIQRCIDLSLQPFYPERQCFRIPSLIFIFKLQIRNFRLTKTLVA